MQSYNIELFPQFSKKNFSRKVLHVYAIYQKYTIITFNSPNFPNKPSPLESVCEIRGEVYMQYTRNAEL